MRGGYPIPGPGKGKQGSAQLDPKGFRRVKWTFGLGLSLTLFGFRIGFGFNPTHLDLIFFFLALMGLTLYYIFPNIEFSNLKKSSL